jgi:hypothetical protein
MRIGWADALKLLDEDGYKFQELADGTAELMHPGTNGKHAGAMWFLTKRSTQLLKWKLNQRSPSTESNSPRLRP